MEIVLQIQQTKNISSIAILNTEENTKYVT